MKTLRAEWSAGLQFQGVYFSPVMRPAIQLYLPDGWGCQALWLPGRLPGFNQLLEANSRVGKLVKRKSDNRTVRWNRYNSLKREWTATVQLAVLKSRITPIQRCVIAYEFHLHADTRDYSNIAAGAVKFIEDALVKTGTLPSDAQNYVLGSVCTFERATKQGCSVSLYHPLPF